ncbi:hypothetical protein QQM79_10500 [Marinobacteraceae bacterium S3BR75-40.1]
MEAILPEARWPAETPLSSSAIRVAEQHAILGINRFLARNALPRRYRTLFPALLIPMAAWLVQSQRRLSRPMIIGVSGSQGSGKTTLAQALQVVLRDSFAVSNCILSLDDFYLPQSDRLERARQVHPLLETRGVPGTHDITLLADTIAALIHPTRQAPVPLPHFDKGRDDRTDETLWTTIPPRPEIILLEGWCVGARQQSARDLNVPINDLEYKGDPGGHWRQFVNEQLAGPYQALFAKLDRLVYLKAPDWEAVKSWRWQQEVKLEKSQGGDYRADLLDVDRFAHFMAHYERLTRAMLEQLPREADIVLHLNHQQQLIKLQTEGVLTSAEPS